MCDSSVGTRLPRGPNMNMKQKENKKKIVKNIPPTVNIRDFKQGLRKRLVRRILTAEEWDEYVESRQNSKPLFTLSKP